jgi:hypothetical protein
MKREHAYADPFHVCLPTLQDAHSVRDGTEQPPSRCPGCRFRLYIPIELGRDAYTWLIDAHPARPAGINTKRASMGKIVFGIAEILFGAMVLIGLSMAVAEAGFGTSGDLAKRVFGLCLGAIIAGTGVYHLISGVRNFLVVPDENESER